METHKLKAEGNAAILSDTALASDSGEGSHLERVGYGYDDGWSCGREHEGWCDIYLWYSNASVFFRLLKSIMHLCAFGAGVCHG